MRCSLRYLVFFVVLYQAMSPVTVGAQSQTDPQEILQQLEQGGLVPGGAMGARAEPGTWVYPVGAGLHTEFLKDERFPKSRGVDTDFVAKASLMATQTVRGPDLCNPGERGVSDFRLVAMQPKTGEGPFEEARQESRLIVNQEETRVVLYLHGEVREWKPGPEFCGGERQMVEASSGSGTLRLEYQTTGHLAPLHFTGGPRPNPVNGGGDDTSIGELTWAGKTVKLSARGLGPGAPAAIATGPVQSTLSVADALALARAYGAGEEVPSAAEVEEKLPEGMDLDALAINMTGQADAGRQYEAGMREWFLSYHITLVDDGEKIAKGWVDPWR